VNLDSDKENKNTMPIIPAQRTRNFTLSNYGL